MRIRSIVFAFCLSLGALSQSSPSHAQPPAAAPGGFDVESRLAELRTRLSLDANQTAQIRAILTDAKQQMDALRASIAPAQRGPQAFEAFRQQRRAILFRTEDRIWALLTCPQKDAFRLYVREQMEERMENRAAPPAGPRGRGRRR